MTSVKKKIRCVDGRTEYIAYTGDLNYADVQIAEHAIWDRELTPVQLDQLLLYHENKYSGLSRTQYWWRWLQLKLRRLEEVTRP
jgi:hypothetical protein